MSLTNCVCFHLGLAHRRVMRAYEDALSPLGLTVAQAHFLAVLFESDASLSRDVAKALGVDACTLTPMVDRLARQGLVKRCPHPDDRRATRLCLEEAAWALRPHIEARLSAVNAAIKNKLTPLQWDFLLDLTKRLSDEDGFHADRMDYQTV